MNLKPWMLVDAVIVKSWVLVEAAIIAKLECRVMMFYQLAVSV